MDLSSSFLGYRLSRPLTSSIHLTFMFLFGEIRFDLTVFILKEKQTRESTTSCSKYSFKIADRTGEVTSKHFFEMVDKTDLI